MTYTLSDISGVTYVAPVGATPGTLVLTFAVVGDHVFAAPSQQVTVGASPTANPLFSRSARISDEAFYMIRYGTDQVAMLLTAWGKICGNIVGGLTSAPRFTAESMTPATGIRAIGEVLAFSVTTTQEFTATYQWQECATNSVTPGDWANCVTSADETIANATSATTFTVTPLTAGKTGWFYRCKATAAAQISYSDSYQLTVTGTLPAIGSQPADATVAHGSSTTFAVASVTGTAPITYQWQVSSDGGGVWADCVNFSAATGGIYTNVTTATLTVAPPTASPYNGYKFRCVLTNVAGTTTSSAKTLTVT